MGEYCMATATEGHIHEIRVVLDASEKKKRVPCMLLHHQEALSFIH
jgi:hypothetical protein